MPSTFLHEYSPSDWVSGVETLAAADVHPVDRDALRIWSAFFPLALADRFAASGDVPGVVRHLRIDGNARLVDGQIDTSHAFLYGQRYWPLVREAVMARVDGVGGGTPSLPVVARELAASVGARAHVDARLLTGIIVVGLMTLRQAGVEALRTAAAAPAPPQTADSALSREAPDRIVVRRERDDSQGVLGLLRGTKRFSVTFDERHADARFSILDGQHLTTAAAADGRDYTLGPRRFHEGPIPAQCRSATCGTCWVGVLGGREKLNAIEPYEARKLREFGYASPSGSHPLIRLACQAKASGNVTIAIPSWHGFIAPLHVAPLTASPTETRR